MSTTAPFLDAIPAGTYNVDPAWAQDHRRKSLRPAGARVLDADLAVPKSPERFAGPNGELTDTEARERLASLVEDLVAAHETSAPRRAAVA